MQKIILKVDSNNYENIILHLNKIFKSNISITEKMLLNSEYTDKKKNFYREFAQIDSINMRQLDDVLLSR
jgi:hypothetical protein